MYRLILSLGLLASIFSGIMAQEEVGFNTINRETYRLYLAGEWDSLIVLGKQAIRQEMDFYYLRMRMGIAYYQEKNYMHAAGHFKRALEFNQNAPAALEQLYYACLMAGQAEQARLIRKQFKGDLALKLPPPKGKFADRLGVEYLYNKGLNDELLADPGILFEGLLPGVQYVNRHFSNLSLSLVNSITPGFTLAHTYTFLSKTNHFYYNDGSKIFDYAEQHVSQHQYYISPTITTKAGFKFSPMFHLIRVQYQAPVDFVQGYQGGSSQVLLGTLDATNVIGGLKLSKGIGSMKLNLGGWYASLNEAIQFQNRLGLTWYPLGNLNLYASACLNSQYEQSDRDSTLRLIPEFHLGFAIQGKVWLDLNGSMGEMINYLENNGSIVYNSFSEVLRKKMTLTLSVPVSEKGSLLYLGGRWSENESRFFSVDPTLENTSNNIQYNTLSIYGGISWKF
jgi:hypothetical protein